MTSPHSLAGTYTKSFGSCGGYIAGSRQLIDHLRRHSPAHLYATAMSPGSVQQVISAMRLINGDDGTTRGRDKVRARRGLGWGSRGGCCCMQRVGVRAWWCMRVCFGARMHTFMHSLSLSHTHKYTHTHIYIHTHWQVKQLHDNANYFRHQLIEMGLHVLGDWDSPVMPIMIYHPGACS